MSKLSSRLKNKETKKLPDIRKILAAREAMKPPKKTIWQIIKEKMWLSSST